MDNPVANGRHWFALYTKPRHEFKAAEYLRDVSIEYYLPTIITTRKWSDRKKKIETPLFAGYIFIHANEKERNLSLQHNTIVKTICFLGKPSVIPDYQIENLRRMLTESPEVFVSNRIETGSQIKIVEGPFEGVTGIVQESESERWLFVTVDIVNRSVSVKLPKESVIKYVEK